MPCITIILVHAKSIQPPKPDNITCNTITTRYTTGNMKLMELGTENIRKVTREKRCEKLLILTEVQEVVHGYARWRSR